ncbi:MAG: carboxymuconolactone decarboxylase family protein [Allosphingosinicella sp.]
MPPGAEPLLLFRTVGASKRAWTKFAAGSLLDKGPLPLREREIVIHRTAARCGCGYEWGIHAALFAERAGLSEQQLLGTAAEDIDSALWSEEEAVLLQTVDALIERKRLGDEEFLRLSRHFSTDQILEIIQLVAFYHGVALICGALDLASEPGTPKNPNLPS